MPQVIPYLVAAAASAGGATAAQAAFAALVASAFVGGAMASNAEARQRRRNQEAIRSRNITLRSAVAPRTLVLGTARTSGPLMYAEFVGTTQEYLDTIVAINAGEIGEVVGVYIGDEYIAASAITSSYPTTGKYAVSTLDSPSVEESFTVTGATSVTLTNTPDTPAVSYLIHSTGSGDNLNQQPVTPTSVVGAVVSWATAFTGTVTVGYRSAGAIRAPLRVQWAMGTAAQASTTWSAVSTPRWTSNHRLRGVAYVRTLKLIDDPLFLAGDNGDVGAVIRGPAGVYDPRTLTTVSYSSNPALLAAWYRTLAVADGGMGVPSAWIDWATVATAANICDELISVRKLDNSGYENVKRYECNTRLSLDAAPADNLQIILDCMAGDFPFTAGVYKCFAGAFRTATVTLTDDDVLASETIAFVPQAGASVAPPNIVTGTFYDRARNWVQQPAAAVTNATYVTADGAEEILEMDLQGTTDERQANYLMGVHLERNRPSLAAMLTVTGKGANLGLLDTVQINLTGYSAIAGKTFEVRRRTNNWTGRYPLELREIKAATYTLDADRFTAAPAVSAPVNSALFDVTPPTVTAAVEQLVRQADGSIISVAEVTWSSHPQGFVRERGSIRLRWKRATAAEWSYGSPLSGAALKGTTGALVDGAVVQIEVQATNGAGAASVWVAAPLVTVVGKSARPADVLSFGYTASEAGLELSWAPATDVDYDSTIVKSGATWATATTLFRGAASRWTWPRPSSGSYTLLAKHVDSTGNESLNAASLTIAYTSTPVANANIALTPAGALTGGGGGQVQLPSLPGLLTPSQLELELGKSIALIPPSSAGLAAHDLNLTSLAAAVAQLSLSANVTANALSGAGIFTDPASGTVRISAVEQTAAALNSVAVTVNAHTAAINLRATTSYVDQQIAAAVLTGGTVVFTALDTRLTTAEANISGLTASVALKADSTTVNSQGARLTTAETNISGLTGTVATKANSSTVTALDTRVTTAETNISALGSQASAVTDLQAGAYRLANNASAADASTLAALLAVWQSTQTLNTALALAHEELTAKVNGDVSAEAVARLLLAARVAGAEAAIVTEQLTRATADAATASQVSTLQARLNTGDIATSLAAVSTSASATASAVSGLNAQLALKVQTTRSDGKLVLAGIGLASTSTGTTSQSEIILAADTLTFVPSSNPNAATAPLLTTGTVNGVTKLIITSAVIGDLTVGTLALAEGAATEVYSAVTNSGPVNLSTIT